MGVKGWYIQFSKILTLLFSLVMLPLSGYVVYRGMELAELAIVSGYMGALPYVTAIVGFVEIATGYVLGRYFGNSEKEKIARAQYGAAGEETKKDI